MKTGFYVDCNGTIRHTSWSMPHGEVSVVGATVQIIDSDGCVFDEYSLWKSYSDLRKAIDSTSSFSQTNR